MPLKFSLKFIINSIQSLFFESEISSCLDLNILLDQNILYNAVKCEDLCNSGEQRQCCVPLNCSPQRFLAAGHSSTDDISAAEIIQVTN